MLNPSTMVCDDHTHFVIEPFSLSLTIDPAQLDTRGPCSKYELDIAEGKFKGKIKFILEGGILRVSHTP